MHRPIVVVVALATFLVMAWSAAADQGSVVRVLNVQGVIGPVNADYVARGIDAARTNSEAAVVVRLDTPGGLDTAMRQMVQSIVNSPVPVVVWVAPAGSRAASAGLFIALAGHIAAMAPDTAIGAAHPVASSGESIAGDMRDKVTNDAVAYVRDLAERRGRNADWAERAVRDSISASSSEALKQNVVDLVVADLPGLLDKIDGRTVSTAAGPVTLRTSRATVVSDDLNFVEQLLLVLTDPTIAAFLLGLAGIALYFEMANPGSIFPGVVGVIALLLALYGLGTLPVNWAGLGLIGLGFVLFFLETFVTSHGMLGAGGIVCLGVGFLMLVNSSAPYLQVSRPAIAGLVVGLGAALAATTTLAVRTRWRKVVTGREALIGKAGIVRRTLDPRGLVFVDGELWEASAETTIDAGATIIVEAIDGLVLHVAPTAK